MPTSLKLTAIQQQELAALSNAAELNPSAVGAYKDFYLYLARVILNQRVARVKCNATRGL